MRSSGTAKSSNWRVLFLLLIIIIGIVTKGLVQRQEDLEIREQVETIQTITFLRAARILRRVLETYYHSDTSEKPSAIAGVKNSQKLIIIIIMQIGTEVVQGETRVGGQGDPLGNVQEI